MRMLNIIYMYMYIDDLKRKILGTFKIYWPTFLFTMLVIIRVFQSEIYGQMIYTAIKINLMNFYAYLSMHNNKYINAVYYVIFLYTIYFDFI